MLLVHQTGSVKVGEVVRYTLTYTPSLDRILPPPRHLHIKIKNTSAIPLRAAYLHGPYTLYTSCYASTFDPYLKQEGADAQDTLDYEPQLKAGGSWTAKLTVPEEVRASIEDSKRNRPSEAKNFTWIIEVASQVLFSTSATVHYELLVGRDEKSVALGVTGVVGQGQGLPGKLEDFQNKRTALKAEVQTRGVFSKAIRLAIDDTETLWNTPPFPTWDEGGDVNVKSGPDHGDKRDADDKRDRRQKKQKKIHLVVLTHGLHSNLGADLLYMKETIDTAARQASKDAKQRKADLRARKAQEDAAFARDTTNSRSRSVPEIIVAPTTTPEDEEDEEQVLVRGFKGNAVKTEKGIQYLGKRLAKYVLSITYPDQPFLPLKSSLSKSITRSFTGQKPTNPNGLKPIHKNSTIVKDVHHKDHNLAYRITSISFIGHSLGGLIQTYAVAYIQKHSPEFFERIEPVNFVALASPFLGLSNENPMYVKFALDFGLVGRTGQDLGLTWRAPTIARSGWGAMVNGLVNDPHKDHQPNPATKPLLRILPTGPAHQALKKFRNRTVYANVVNDGIVPLRTSCLLFLDWRGLGRVEKARRENGLLGTMVNWGWNEVTGQNASTAKKPLAWNDLFSEEPEDGGKSPDDPGSAVPDARASQFLDEDDGRASLEDESSVSKLKQNSIGNTSTTSEDAKEQELNLWTGFLSWFRPHAGSKSPDEGSATPRSSKSPKRRKTPKIYKRGQIKGLEESEPNSPIRNNTRDGSAEKRHGPVRGSSLYTNNSAEENLEAPPRTTFFESAGDLLSPPLPPKEYLLDPAARPRTIFHDRVYHPDDIPPPPTRRQRTFMRMGSRSGSRDSSTPSEFQNELDRRFSTNSGTVDIGSMKIEEKIARAYHKDMAWRKVLVSMKPDAHNNMIVRRMFANAYGWPVIKHLCDTHFAFTATAQTRDDDEDAEERAKPADEAVGSTGEQVKGQIEPPDHNYAQISEQDMSKYRSRSVDRASSHLSSDDNLLRTSQQTITSLSDRVRSREKNAADKQRSLSETRESRDELSDLVSMAAITATGTNSSNFSTSQSGTAALNRLARQDSARWSDRFFDGDGNDSDDDSEYFAEIQRARSRGEIAFADSEHQARQVSASTSFEPRSVVSSSSSAYNSSVRAPKPAHLITDNGDIVAEPDSLTPTTPSSMIANKVPPPNQATNIDPDSRSPTSVVGLGRTVGESLSDSKDKDPEDIGKHSGGGVAEQVALAHAVATAEQVVPEPDASANRGRERVRDGS